MVKGAAIHLFITAVNSWASSRTQKPVGGCVHEVLHIVLHHCTNRASTDPRLHDLDNIAADLAINQLIPNTGHIMRPKEKKSSSLISLKVLDVPEKAF